MKNTFYFKLKTFFVLKLFRFLSWLFGHVEKRPDQQKDKGIANLWHHKQAKKQTTAMYILPNNFGSNGNPAIEFSQLIEIKNEKHF